MRILAAFLVLIFSLSPSQARIGETKAECEERYGKHQTKDPKQPGYDERRVYVKKNIAILIGFQGDEAVLLIYTKFKDRQTLPLSDAEIDTLLEANSNGKKWFPNRQKNQEWERVGRYRAYVDGHALTVISPKYAEAVVKESKKPKHLQGF